jgi:hypothetical protein
MLAGTAVLLAAIDGKRGRARRAAVAASRAGHRRARVPAQQPHRVGGPGELSPTVGGLQNTATNIGASLGIALAGSVLIAVLTATVLTSIQGNPAVPPDVQQQAEIELSSGVPFLSVADLESALEEAGVTGRGDVAEAARSPLAASWDGRTARD